MIDMARFNLQYKHIVDVMDTIGARVLVLPGKVGDFEIKRFRQCGITVTRFPGYVKSERDGSGIVYDPDERLKKGVLP